MKINISVTNAAFTVTNDAGEVIATTTVDNYRVEVEATKLGQAIGTLMRTIEMDSVAAELKRAAAAMQTAEA